MGNTVTSKFWLKYHRFKFRSFCMRYCWDPIIRLQQWNRKRLAFLPLRSLSSSRPSPWHCSNPFWSCCELLQATRADLTATSDLRIINDPAISLFHSNKSCLQCACSYTRNFVLGSLSYLARIKLCHCGYGSMGKAATKE